MIPLRARLDQLKRSVRGRLIAFEPLNRILTRRMVRRMFRDELRLLRGAARAPSARPSFYFFTVHKSASMYVGALLRDLAVETGLTPIDFEKFYYMGGEHEPNVLNTAGAHSVFHKHGFYYGVFHQLHPGIDQLDDVPIIVMVRDPRDVLTSYYYSVAFSHHVPTGNPGLRDRLLAERERAQPMTIDAFVISEAPGFLAVYNDYCDRLIGRRNTTVVKYEEMITDFDAWIDRMVRHADLTPSPDTLERLRAAAVQDGGEDASRHLRQRLPGDHLRKLQPATIVTLTEMFSDVLRRLAYEPVRPTD